MMKIYVAGPMSGIPDHNFPAFHAAADRLSAAGYDVVNPAAHPLPCGCNGADLCGSEHTRAEYLRKSLILMLQRADGVALLPGWERSRGATLEREIAETLDMPVRMVDEWLVSEAA
jgi:hypothetical protein